MAQDSTLPAYVFVVPWSLDLVGGVNQVVINLALEMVRVGSFNPIFFIDDWNSPNPVWEQFNNVPVVRWRIRPLTKGMGLRQRILYAIWRRRFCVSFEKFCHRHKVAAINLHFPGANAFSFEDVLTKCAIDVPLLLSFHGLDVSAIERASPDERSRWRKLTHRSKGLVACSHDLGRRLRDAMVEPNGLAVIHNGVNMSSLIAGAGSSAESSEQVLLSIGKYEKKKGQDVLIKAFASIATEYPDACLVFVGARDVELPRLQGLCMELGVADRVTFHTNIPHAQIAEHFRRACIFVLPSRQEAFPLALLEAGCFGLPVIASRVGGIPELVDDRMTGLLVTPDQPDDLAGALRSLLDDPSKGEAMGRALQLRVTREFTWTRAHDQYVRLVRS
jgi:glycosyltransferase involved in cell wall biosynthesis